MPSVFPEDSVGLVSPQVLHFKEPLPLACGRHLADYELVYETYGTLNAERSNAVLICHALSGHHHAAGYHSVDDRKPGWWDSCIGPQADRHPQVLRRQPQQPRRLQRLHRPRQPQPGHRPRLWRRLPGRDSSRTGWTARRARQTPWGIRQWAAVIGGSLGGMQALQWSISYPERIRHCLVIASCAQAVGGEHRLQRSGAPGRSVTDPEFHGGHF